MSAGSIKRAGPWDESRTDRFLAETVIPVRFAATSRRGFPVLLSLWYLYEEGRLWCAVQEDSRIAGHVARDGRCAFEVAPNKPPYFGVRGQGRAHIVPEKGEQILRLLIQRYLGSESSKLARWLLERSATEVAIRIDPLRLMSWDYAARMEDAGTGGGLASP
jgi:hypothetical protein